MPTTLPPAKNVVKIAQGQALHPNGVNLAFSATTGVVFKESTTTTADDAANGAAAVQSGFSALFFHGGKLYKRTYSGGVAEIGGASEAGGDFIIGEARVFTGGVDQIPANWLLANGDTFSRAAFPLLDALYAAQGYPYGNGDGSTTTTLPDLRGRSVVGLNPSVSHNTSQAIDAGTQNVGNILGSEFSLSSGYSGSGVVNGVQGVSVVQPSLVLPYIIYAGVEVV